MSLIFELSRPGKKGVDLPSPDVPAAPALPAAVQAADGPDLPEVAEIDVVRHFTNLSKKNFGVDSNFYPLGSCTMKYNPKFSEKCAQMPDFAELHPILPQLKHGHTLVQGALEVIYNLQTALCAITGMDEFTCQPLAGAHGELTGILLIAAYHKAMNRQRQKKYILIPDSGHGTNPASAAVGGFEVKSIPSDDHGFMDFELFKQAVDDQTAGLMITCPNTLGLFNPRIKEITALLHKFDALAYYDGANMNAIIGRCRPGDLGFDIVHLNLHKTFSTPHGGGGPGAGPVGVKRQLVPYLPISRVLRDTDGSFYLDYSGEKSIGYIAPFYGNFLVLLRAYAYILKLGRQGLKEVGETAVLNANYLLHHLRKLFPPGTDYSAGCMHEFVLSAAQPPGIVSALDIAKALIDQGIHPPTVYFPLTVKEAMMIEPTETESLATLDHFIKVMQDIAAQVAHNPTQFHDLPLGSPVSRPDEVKAARAMNLRS